jgi:hypothetical protein
MIKEGVKFSFRFIKRHAMKTYVGVEVTLHLTSSGGYVTIPELTEYKGNI